ncbi:MAG: FAD-dependent oxidoreductase [Anaerolineales bacterium]|nr:FAD-dependent oxidoreductase [Anaerolineales bacterium]
MVIQPTPQSHQSTITGAVMVVGGGVTGMQAALDLAEQGFKVYIVENQSAIGGHMAQLDKTFPTNDCAMCSISPKLVDTGRHLNIHLLTSCEVLDVQGEPGKFCVTLKRKPRYIDINKCIACSKCAEVCPVSLPDHFEIGMRERKAAYRLYPQAVPAAYAIEKEGIAPCRSACPAGQRAQGYISLIAEGRYREALRVIKEDNPFPSVCGRTCHHPCEGNCTRALVDEAVGIMSLKRFVVDYALAYGRDQVVPTPRTRPQWIAVIGAGPAGLTTAHDLVKMGYGVTVHEALPVAGGMMQVGIPAHRLPKGILQQDIDDILALGVILKTNSPIRDPQKLLQEGYDAVCLATGMYKSDHTIGLEGEDALGVISAATFLRKINLGESVQIGGRVAVVGGGITALDAAAVARRLGAPEVFLSLDRPRGELPAYQWEVSAVETEGIKILERTVATRILVKDNHVSGIELAQTSRGMSRDKYGRRRPNIKPGTEVTLEVDTVIITVGQFSDLSFLDEQFHDLPADEETLASDIPGIFVVGGQKTGASFIIEAVALGHRVSQSIHHYLQRNLSKEAASPPFPVVKFSRSELSQRVNKGEIIHSSRTEPALLPIEERVTSFREVVLGLTEIQARKEANRCLQCGVCSECLACVYACEVDAIDHSMRPEEIQLEVGAMILAPGYQVYDAALSEEYGFGRYPDVITSLQFERMLSASGPTMGYIKRPSNNKTPERIAFIQCVGSRDLQHDYCSSVCCMYATKEAMIAKEHHPDLKIEIFLMDLRAFSKGYWEYFERARQRFGIQYHHCRVSMVRRDPITQQLIIQFPNETGKITNERFDMVVLSVGMEMSESVRHLGRRLGVELDDYGFCHSVNFNPLETTKPGIFAAGPFREPKDIPESVIEASGAAASAATLLSPARYSLTSAPEFPPERDISQEEPRIGVFVCSCGSNIGGFLDVPAVTNFASQLPQVTHSEWNLYTCSQEGISLITKKVKEHNLNRVVVASCSPLTHQQLFQDSIRSAGLNPFLFEMANIRNQCSWVHSHDWQVATDKAKDLVNMAVRRAATLESLNTVEVTVNPTALVVGAGAAGMTAALTLADQGFPVHLVEREKELGGNLRHLFIPLANIDPQEVLKELVTRVQTHPNITLHLENEVFSTQGFKGNFKSTLIHKSGSIFEIDHGATILATGAQEYHCTDYNYGSHPRIITQLQFEQLLLKNLPYQIEHDNGKELNPLNFRYDVKLGDLYDAHFETWWKSAVPENIVMIQCVGLGEKYCSRVCCTQAIKNALWVKEFFPNIRVTILYRDIRTYGFKESLYTEARKRGVDFIRYNFDQKPELSYLDSNNTTAYQIHSSQANLHSKIIIRVWDANINRWLELTPDLVVLSMAVIPSHNADRLASTFKVAIDRDGFFQEAHVKLRPVDFASEGLYMAGMAHYPKLLEESMIQAYAAASRAARVLSRQSLISGGRIAVVEPDRCIACLTCVRVCPFNIPKIRTDLVGSGGLNGSAFIEPAVCQGCGVCAAECPAQAIQLLHYKDMQMNAYVGALFET